MHPDTGGCCGTMDIRAEVMRLSYAKVRALLKAAGLRANGKSAVLREELIAHRGGSTPAAGPRCLMV